MGLYIHWPFCKAKCPYCDFNSHVREGVDPERWAAAYERALAHWAERLGGRPLRSIFFGGGTPSLMPPRLVERILAAAHAHWPWAEDIEITLEANPTSVEAAHFAGYRAAGVNRVSLGIQALDDASLHFLGRQHSVAEALAALKLAQRHFERVTFDLIYARAGQTLDGWRAELGQALDYGTDHLSLYQLTIEPGTPFAARFAAGGLDVLDEDAAADLFALTQEMTAKAGLPSYEISNHARLGAESRHNLIYWRYQDYLGVGPGAHGRVTLGAERLATVDRRSPEGWLEAVEADGQGLAMESPVTALESATEAVMMGLRLKDGLDIAHMEALSGLPLDAVVDGRAVTLLTQEGLLERAGDHLRLTPKGWPLLNSITGALLAG
jgi:oxygen-independent coproporphyrinogen-3 oxidase